ncbi:CRISPR-associated endonuclease/helicase Cas3 [Arenibacter nanhaiticus]|uniref:CRISPR-associated endonuclease/helicase Cas3 n=1 Tax=Arenibacter nanhaiticus TaxID=558155 RepID=A0A1M6JXI6_9FLAO|nr:CRISPR-associated helicase/endonuclease Cas3 [Arenibacter nanhaiticus]SHJ51430.1 CRISPR-associated endonuclease/helicase Cas3 [Arenibacter nanhaiticus]
MNYYSHSKLIEYGVTEGSKELQVHVNGVKEKALFHLAEGLSLGYNAEELKEIVGIIVDFHDLGKYTSYFQNYLLKQEPIDFLLKRHAQLGGFVAYNYFQEKDEKKALLALYLIFLHHSPLIDFVKVNSKFTYDLDKIIKEQIADLEKKITIIEDDLKLKKLKDFLYYSDKRKIRNGFIDWVEDSCSIQDYYLINYLFSLLIEGDKLDASDTVPYRLKPIKPSSVDDRFGKLNAHNKSLEELNNNELRNYCRAVVISNLEQTNILEHFVFTLTAPTGIGKTMTALDFSLKLKDKIKKNSGVEARIIYALPFINIIEQALNEYDKVLETQNINILGHYQYADVFGNNEQKENVDGAEQGYDQKLMALDTWQADVVITSFVQFFETLIGNRNRLLKKFNHFANSIIILDEVQTLRLDQMPLLGAALFYLSKFLKSRIILMTATRPKIFELAQQEILNPEGEKVEPKELLTNYEAIFALFKRTSINPLLNNLKEEKENRTREFVYSIFADKWNAEKSCLIVCNTVKRSIEVFDIIKNFLEENNLGNPIYYLSTNIIPAHRLERIQDIKGDIQHQKAPILIATQVVEAGVDLDFDMGFRDIGPIDSIIQVAGRINRNNDIEKIHSPLYIIDFDVKATTMVYGRLTYIQAKKSLEQKKYFYEKEYLELITTYFDGISEKSSFADARTFFNSMKTLKYDADDKKLLPVSAFRIIEESDRYSPVFIEIDDSASEILEKYLQKITNEIELEEYNKNWKLKFQQHIISVPKYLCEELSTVNEYEESILLVPKKEIDIRYSKQTGYNRNFKEQNSVFTF